MKLLKIGEIILNNSLAVATALSHKSGPPLSFILAAMTAAKGLAELATARSVPAFAKGGSFETSGPQMIMVGDNPGGRERVDITPISSPNIAGPQGGSSVVVNVSGNIMSQDYVEGELADAIKTAIRRGSDFGIS